MSIKGNPGPKFKATGQITRLVDPSHNPARLYTQGRECDPRERRQSADGSTEFSPAFLHSILFAVSFSPHWGMS